MLTNDFVDEMEAHSCAGQRSDITGPKIALAHVPELFARDPEPMVFDRDVERCAAGARG